MPRSAIILLAAFAMSYMPFQAEAQSCTDVAPSGGYTCAQQASWGKCDESWMNGYCQKSCNKCTSSGSNGGSGGSSVSGLGNRKRAITSAGGNSLDLATAMLETENMGTNYVYGDAKTQDAANFGIFKQNWGMLRVCCSRFRGQQQSQWNNGAVLNSNLQADISCLHECQGYYGTDRWFAGHRNGASGLSNPNTQDIQNYR
ncbi:hypothetical protein HK097_008637, partial [Rhizophlyctis rosea]